MDAFNRMMCGSSRGRKRGLCGIKGGSDNFTKKDIVDYVSGQTGISKLICNKAITECFNYIKLYASDVYEKGDKAGEPKSCVTIAGFGSFKSKRYKYNSTLHGKKFSGYRVKMFLTPSEPKKK